MRKLLFIFNTAAGRAQLCERLFIITDFYIKQDFVITLLSITQLKRLSEVLTMSEQAFDILVCAGGDGTLNSVISEYMKIGCSLPIGYLPMGSTNDFARSLGYTADFTETLKRSCMDFERQIDVGRFNDRYFVYVAAFGSLAEVSYSTPQSTKNVLGHFAYILNGIQKITDLKAYKLILECDQEKIEGVFCMGFVMNSFSIGGFKNPVSEYVELDDGLFEVLLIKMPKNLSELQQIIADLLGQRINGNMFIYLQTDVVKIHSECMSWTLDGEFGGVVDMVEIQNCQKAIRLLGGSMAI